MPPAIVFRFGFPLIPRSIAAGSFSWLRNGGSMSPQFRPLLVEKSMPHWLNPTRLSFWPPARLFGSVGLATMSSSACRRYVQSWLTRALPLLVRLPQPSECAGCARQPGGLPQPPRVQHGGLYAQLLDLADPGPVLQEDDQRVDTPAVEVTEKRPEHGLRSAQALAPGDRDRDPHRFLLWQEPSRRRAATGQSSSEW